MFFFPSRGFARFANFMNSSNSQAEQLSLPGHQPNKFGPKQHGQARGPESWVVDSTSVRSPAGEGFILTGQRTPPSRRHDGRPAPLRSLSAAGGQRCGAQASAAPPPPLPPFSGHPRFSVPRQSPYPPLPLAVGHHHPSLRIEAPRLAAGRAGPAPAPPPSPSLAVAAGAQWTPPHAAA